MFPVFRKQRKSVAIKSQQYQLARVNRLKKHVSFFTKLIVPARMSYIQWNAPLCKKQYKNHNFNKNTKFIITDQLTNTKKPKEILRQSLIQRENNFWFQTLDTIYPEGLKQELSK